MFCCHIIGEFITRDILELVIFEIPKALSGRIWFLALSADDSCFLPKCSQNSESFEVSGPQRDAFQ